MRVLSGTETPLPTPTSTVDPDLVTPGFPGFVVIVIVVVVVALLIWDMNRRVRRVRYRDEVRAELDAEEAAARAADEPVASGPSAASIDGSESRDEADGTDPGEPRHDEPRA